MLTKYLNDSSDLNLLKRFAFTGNRESLNSKLDFLIRIAENELWTQTDSTAGWVNSTIFYYIVHTFDRCFNQNKIEVSDDETVAVFNTGLMTPQGDEIYCSFTKSLYYNELNPRSNYWHLKGFETEGSKRFIELNVKKPELATYFDDFNDLYFDPKKDVVLNFDHIYDDNFERLPLELQSLDKEIARHVFEGFLDFTKKKITRNNRIPVPQFYNEKIMFLIPVIVFGTKTVVIALEEINGTYVGNTVLTMGMAYNCARLINRPESDWLISKEI